MTKDAAKSVLIALPGATYQDLRAELAAGRVPAIAGLIARGWGGPLTGASPVAGPAGAATLATGLPAGRHGLALDEEAWPGGMRTVTAASWRVSPIWSRLAEAGVATASVGWPATVPGAGWPGLHVDDRFGLPTGRIWDDWALPPDVAPPTHRAALREVRVHPTDVTAAVLQPFVPNLAAVDQEADGRLVPIALALARLTSDHAAMRIAVERGQPDALFVHHAFLRTLGRDFRAAAAPFDGVMAAAWTLIDAIVGETVASVAGATVVLAASGWPGAAGFVVMSGGAAGRQATGEAQAQDIAPTLLAVHGLADPALPGRSLITPTGTLRPAPTNRPPVAPPCPRQGDAARIAAFGLKPLETPPPFLAKTLAAEAEAALAGDPALALERAEAAERADPGSLLTLGLQAAVHVAQADGERLSVVAVRLRAIAPDHPWTALAEAGTALLAARPDAAVAPLARADAAARDPITLRHVASGWRMARRPAEAARTYRRILAIDPDDAVARVGLAETRGERMIETERTLRQVLRDDPGHGSAKRALARLLRSTGRTHEARVLESGTR